MSTCSRSGGEGLAQPRGQAPDDWLHLAVADGGVEFLSARFTGRAYAKHRHDTYAICVTDFGIQAFDYRGTTRTSTPGKVVVLHPDEAHDGRAGSEAGFGYRIVYVAPARIAAAASALCGRAVPLPFAAEPVSANPTLGKAVARAFMELPSALEPLGLDALIESLTRGLLEADASMQRPRRRLACDTAAVERARLFLEAEKTRVVTSAELEQVSGHDRFSLTRQFRCVHGTSPYRYLLMRRLDLVRSEVRTGAPLAEIAIDTGFADQAHMTRLFRASYGMSPSQFRALSRRTVR